MTGLALRLAWAGGRGRALLLAACTAAVSGLVLVVVTVLSLPGEPQEHLYAVVADPGTRGGYALSTLLLSLAPLLLLHQAVRLGTSARERRLAALRLAGATPGEVRRIGALEVGMPALVGALGGIGVYWLLRLVLGGNLAYTRSVDGGAWQATTSLRIVPTSVVPTWWQLLAVVAVVTLLGVGTGALAARRVVVSPLGLSRRSAPRRPRPWGLLLVAAGLVSGVGYTFGYNSLSDEAATAIPLLAVALLVLGLVGLAPWTAYVVGRAVADRARSAHVLLAARRLVADPRPAGRAAAALGGIGLVAGGASAFVAEVATMTDYDVDYYLVGAVLAAAALVLALVAVVGSLAVHSVESLLDRKRAIAALSALGAPEDLLVRAQRWEAGLVAVPMTLGGALLGIVATGVSPDAASLGWAVSSAVTLVVLAVLVWVAVHAAVRLVRPWTLSASAPGNLRTE